MDTRRPISDTNFSDILPVPLLVKLPGQRSGRIDDRVVQIVDVFPTVAEVLDVDLPWAVDGVSLLGAPDEDEKEYLLYRKDQSKPMRFTAERLREGLSLAVKEKISVFGSGSEPEGRFYQIGTYGKLVGRPVSELTIGGKGAVESEVFPFFPSSYLGKYEFHLDGEIAPSHIRGRARGSQGDQPIDLAIAVNGIIRATTRTSSVRTDHEWGEWSAIVSERAFREGENEIDVFHIRADGRALELSRTENKVLSLSDGSAPIGVEPIYGIDEEGFYSPERWGDAPARWTNGHARLSIPVRGEEPPRRLRIELLATGPSDSEVQILVNGRALFAGNLPGGRWSSIFNLAKSKVGNQVELEIISETFVPGNGDTRTLGVAVGGIWLMSD
jgi:hypothetical protein